MWDILKHNLKHLLIACDQFLNVLLCMIIFPHEKSYCDETLSSRIYRLDRDGRARWPRVLLDAVARLFGDRDHSHQSYVSEMERKQLPKEFR